MGDRKWEDLPVNCLVDIFTRVGLVSLAEDVPYVCKSWYKATLIPLCWQSLIFGELSNLKSLSEKYEEFSTVWISLFEAFVKSVIRRSHGSANVVAISSGLPITEEIINCIAEGCPSLTMLMLPSSVPECRPINISSMICKWKNMEAFATSSSHFLEESIAQIGIHCKKFKCLGVMDDSIGESEAAVIASLLPNIECLCLKRSRIERRNLIVILKGCKKLVHLDVTDCIGFDVDEEIQRLAAHIPTVNFEGSRSGFNGFGVEFLFKFDAHIPNFNFDLSSDLINSLLEIPDDDYDEMQFL